MALSSDDSIVKRRQYKKIKREYMNKNAVNLFGILSNYDDKYSELYSIPYIPNYKKSLIVSGNTETIDKTNNIGIDMNIYNKCCIFVWGFIDKECIKIEFDEDGDTVAANNSYIKKVLTYKTKYHDKIVENLLKCFTAIVYCNNIYTIAVAGITGFIALFDRKGRCYNIFYAHTDEITKIQYINESYQLVTCSLDGTIKIWNVFHFKHSEYDDDSDDTGSGDDTDDSDSNDESEVNEMKFDNNSITVTKQPSKPVKKFKNIIRNDNDDGIPTPFDDDNIGFNDESHDIVNEVNNLYDNNSGNIIDPKNVVFELDTNPFESYVKKKQSKSPKLNIPSSQSQHLMNINPAPKLKTFKSEPATTLFETLPKYPKRSSKPKTPKKVTNPFGNFDDNEPIIKKPDIPVQNDPTPIKTAPNEVKNPFNKQELMKALMDEEEEVINNDIKIEQEIKKQKEMEIKQQQLSQQIQPNTLDTTELNETEQNIYKNYDNSNNDDNNDEPVMQEFEVIKKKKKKLSKKKKKKLKKKMKKLSSKKVVSNPFNNFDEFDQKFKNKPMDETDEDMDDNKDTNNDNNNSNNNTGNNNESSGGLFTNITSFISENYNKGIKSVVAPAKDTYDNAKNDENKNDSLTVTESVIPSYQAKKRKNWSSKDLLKTVDVNKKNKKKNNIKKKKVKLNPFDESDEDKNKLNALIKKDAIKIKKNNANIESTNPFNNDDNNDVKRTKIKSKAKVIISTNPFDEDSDDNIFISKNNNNNKLKSTNPFDDDFDDDNDNGGLFGNGKKKKNNNDFDELLP